VGFVLVMVVMVMLMDVTMGVQVVIMRGVVTKLRIERAHPTTS
jgi:hypothetical protein